MLLGGMSNAMTTAARGALVAVSDDAVEIARATVVREAADLSRNQAAHGASALDALGPRLFHRPAAELTPRDWDDLAAALAADPLGTTLVGPREVYDAPELRLVVDAVRLGDRESVPVADRYFRAWRAAAEGPAAIRERSLHLLRRWPDDLDEAHWRDLGALIDADQVGDLTGLQVKHGYSHSSLRNQIIDRARGTNVFDQPVDYTTEAQHMLWSRHHDPEHVAIVSDAMEAAISGNATSLQKRLLEMHVDELDELVAMLPDRTNAERRAVARTMTNGARPEYLAWLRRFDTEFDDLVDDAIESAAAGRTLEFEQQVLIASDRARLDAAVAARPVEERVRIMDQALFHAERSDWMRANDPGWSAKLDEAIDATLAGTADGDQRFLLRIEGEHLEPVLARRTYDQQRAYKAIQHEHLPAALAKWERANAPDWERQVGAAIDDVLGPNPSEYSRSVLRLETDRLDELIAGRPFAEQARLAHELMPPSAFPTWRLANDPVHRANVTAAVDRIISGAPARAGDADALAAEAPRLDELLRELPADTHERIARAALGPTTREFAAWMLVSDANTPARLRAAGDAAVAGALSAEQRAALSQLGPELTQVLDGRPFRERARILRAMQGSLNGGVMRDLWTAQEPERSRHVVLAAAEATAGELSDDARLLLWDERTRLDELVQGFEYEAKLRVADAVFPMPSWLQGWKERTDPDRVARISASAARIADGLGTPHDHRVLKGETNVLGILRDRPYAERLRVAEVAFDGFGFDVWRRANDPGYQARLVAAIDQVEAGAPSPQAVELLASDRSNVFRLLADRSSATQGAVAVAVLGRQTAGFEGILAAMRDLAVDASTRLKALPEDDMTTAIRASTTELLERNVRRMSGFNPSDPNPGYAQHPDYAEMGRVQSNLEMLEAIAKGRTTAVNAAEVLTW